MRYASGEVRPTYRDRAVTKEAKRLFDKTRMAGMQVDASVALAGHIMENIAELDAKRMAIAGDDPVLGQMLLEIEVAAVRQAKVVQSTAHSSWGLR